MILGHRTKLDQRKGVRAVGGTFTAKVGVQGGTLSVGTGSLVSGVTAYAYLILAAHQLGPLRYSALSTAWTAVFLIGPGCFAPLEQEVCRVAVERTSAGLGARPAVVRSAQVGMGILVVALMTAVSVTVPLRHRLFDSDWTLVLALALGLGGYYLMHLSWGVLASAAHFRGYGMVTGSEGAVRLVICLAVLLIAPRSLGAYALALGIAPFAAAVIGWKRQPVHLEPGPREPWKGPARAIGFLLGATLLRQFLLMVGPIVVQLFAAGSQRSAAGRFLAALALTRVPLFLFTAVLAALLPRLAAFAAEGHRREFESVLRRLAGSVVVMTIIAGAGVVVVGPWLLRVVFGPAYSLGGWDLLLLVVSCGLYMVASVLSYGLVAVNGHHHTTLAWGTGCVAFLAVAVAGSDLGLLGRVEWGFLAGTTAAAVVMAALLVRSHRAHPWTASDDLLGEHVA